MLHLNICRESLRSKECSRTNCRFFHLKGTRITEKEWNDSGRREWREETRREEGRWPRREESSEDGRRADDRGSIAPRKNTKSKDQVFLESQQAMMTMMAKMTGKMDLQMTEMREWSTQRTQNQTQYRPRTDPYLWRNPPRGDSWTN